MNAIRIAAALGLLCLPLAVLSAPASAATAHNSQAGANGGTSNVQKPLMKRMKMKSMKKM